MEYICGNLSRGRQALLYKAPTKVVMPVQHNVL